MRTLVKKPKAFQQVNAQTTVKVVPKAFKQDPNVQYLLRVQRDTGNNAVQRPTGSGLEGPEANLSSAFSMGLAFGIYRRPLYVGRHGSIQLKSKVNPRKDKYEQEADHVADRVLHMPERPGFFEIPGRRESQRANGRALAQNPKAGAALQNRIPALDGRGQALPQSERAFFEPRFHYDLGQVRVHTDTRAAEVAGAVNARALTAGTDIVFGAGQFSPQTSGARYLLAHELTHVIQQTGGLRPEQGRGLPAISNLPSPSLQRLPERELRREELRRQAESFSDDELELRILDLQQELSGASSERSPAAIPGEEQNISPFLPEGGLSEKSPIPEMPQGIMRDEGQRSAELEALQWERRRRERRDRRLVLESLADLLDHRVSGWHRILPESSVSGLSTTPGVRARGHRPRREPAVRYPAGASVATEPFDRDVPWGEVRELYIRRVRGRLAGVSVPTETGQLRLWGGQARRRAGEFPGYVWGRRTDLPEGYADEYTQFWQDVRSARTPDEARAVGIELSGARDEGMWNMFLFLTGEGDPAAINTWDDQILTVGAGFSARSGNAAALYSRMPPAFHDILYRYGIFVDIDTNEFVVLDLDRGAVVRGDDALHILQVDQQRLSLLINTAMSSETMIIGADETREEASARVWMLRANFEQFKEINRSVPTAVLGWPQARRRYAFLLHHWMGSVDWRGMAATGGVPRDLAVYAYGRLLGHFAGREGYLWRRLQSSARRAGAGGIGARPVAAVGAEQDVE